MMLIQIKRNVVGPKFSVNVQVFQTQCESHLAGQPRRAHAIICRCQCASGQTNISTKVHVHRWSGVKTSAMYKTCWTHQKLLLIPNCPHCFCRRTRYKSTALKCESQVGWGGQGTKPNMCSHITYD